MKPLLVLIQPRVAAGGALTTIRLASSASGAVGGVGGQNWEMAIIRRPRLTLDLFSPALDGKVQTGKGDLVFSPKRLKQAAANTLYWPGAPITIYDATNLDLATAPIEFTGYVKSASQDLENDNITLTFEVSTEGLDKPLLFNEFDGSGGVGGTAEFRGKPKPAGFGVVNNVEPVWFDPTNNVGMIDGYGNVTAINALFEGASSMGARVADYATYATLVARIADKTVPPGRWATCVAQGLVGLGAPPVKPITVDAQFGTNRPGALIQRLMTVHAGIPIGQVDVPALAALDVAVNRAVHYWTGSARQVRDLIEAIAASCNATPLVTFQGLFSIVRAFGGANIATIDRQAPIAAQRVTKWRSLDVDPPSWRMKLRTSRPGVVLETDQILYADDLLDMGVFNAATTYRQGNLVWSTAGAQYLYINPTAASGNPLPVAPAVATAYWQLTKPQPGAADLYYADGTPIENLKPAQAGADVTLTHTAHDIQFQGEWATFAGSVASITGPLTALTGDDWLSREEKRLLLQQMNKLDHAYTQARTRALALGLSVTALTNAKNAMYSWLNNIAWDNQQADTLIYSPKFGDRVWPGAPWTLNNATVTGSAPWWTLTDTSGAAVGNIVRVLGGLAASTTGSLSIPVLKDAVPRATRHVRFRIQGQGGAANTTADVLLDTSTGEFSAAGGSNAGVLDAGDRWIVYLTLTTAADNTSIRVQIYPSPGINFAADTNAPAAAVTIGEPYFSNGSVNNTGDPYYRGVLAQYADEIETIARLISEKDWGADVNGGIRDGGTTLPRTAIVTSEGTALNILGQGTLATQSALLASQFPYFEGANALVDPELNDPAAWSLTSSGTAPAPTIVASGADANVLAMNVRNAFKFISTGASATNSPRALQANFTPTQASESYRAVARCRLTAGFNGMVRLGWIGTDASGTQTTYFSNLLDYRTVALGATTTFDVVTGVMTNGSTITRMQPFAQLIWGASAPAGQAYVGGMSFRQIVRLGRDLTAADGVTSVGDTDLITSLGTAGHIVSQGLLATLDKAGPSEVNIGETSNAFPDADLQDTNTWTLIGSATKAISAANGIRFSAGRMQFSLPVAAQSAVDAAKSKPFPVDSGKIYYFGAAPRLVNALAGRQVDIKIAYYSDTAATTEVGTRTLVKSATTTTAAFGGVLALIPSNAIRVRVIVVLTTPAADVAASFYLYDVIARRMDELQVAGSGAQIGDGRQLPPIVAAGVGYRYSNNPTFTSAAGTPATGTISLAAGNLRIGDLTVSYNAMSVNVTGTGGSTSVFNLYIDDAGWLGGTATLVATTSTTTPYNASARIFLGQVSITFPTSGTGSGNGTGGGGGGLECPAADAWVETLERGYQRAADVRPRKDGVPGDMVLALTEDMDGFEWVEVLDNYLSIQPAVKLTAASGATLRVSTTTPLTLRDGSAVAAGDTKSEVLPLRLRSAGDGLKWETTAVAAVGLLTVAHIFCGGRVFAAGDVEGEAILTHNPQKP